MAYLPFLSKRIQASNPLCSARKDIDRGKGLFGGTWTPRNSIIPRAKDEKDRQIFWRRKAKKAYLYDGILEKHKIPSVSWLSFPTLSFSKRQFDPKDSRSPPNHQDILPTRRVQLTTTQRCNRVKGIPTNK